MSSERVKEEYRGHILLAALHGGKYAGRIWKDKEVVCDMDGVGIEQLVTELKKCVDDLLDKMALEAGHTPDEVRVVEGLRKFLPRLHGNQALMLKAHYHAQSQTLTPKELADAAGYKDLGAVNLHYGAVGKALYEYAPIQLHKNNDGEPIYTCYLADPERVSEDKNLWRWKLRPEVAKAIEILGLDA